MSASASEFYPQGQSGDTFATGGAFAESDDDDLARKVQKDKSDAMGVINGQRGLMKTDHAFYHAHQWDDVDRLRMEQMKRPALVYNRLKAQVNAISGIERLNRMSVRYVTRALDSTTQEDKAGDLATEAREAALDLCAGNEERSRAALDVLIGGLGVCLSGDSMVETPTIKAASTRLYSGVIIDVYLKSGKKITGTPNHPVLTNAGWKPLGSLNERDYLISGSILERVVPGATQDFDHVPTRLEDKVNAFSAGRKALRHFPRRDDFHGDGIGSEVCVIWADSFLRRKIVQATINQHLKQARLILDSWGMMLGAALFPHRLQESLFVTGIGGTSISRRHMKVSYSSSFGHGTQIQPSFSHSAADHFVGHAKMFPNLEGRHFVDEVHFLKNFDGGLGPSSWAAFFRTLGITNTATVLNQPVAHIAHLFPKSFPDVIHAVAGIVHRLSLVHPLGKLFRQPGAPLPSTGSGGIPASLEPVADGASGYTEHSSDGVLRKAPVKIQLSDFVYRNQGCISSLGISVSRVVRRGVTDFPVHSLTTSIGIFITEGIITSNCEVRTDYAHDIDGRVVLERWDPFEGIWDPNSTGENLKDATWLGRERALSRKLFKSMWGEELLGKVEASMPGDWDGHRTERYELVTPYYSRQNEKANPQIGDALPTMKTIPVIQYQWRDFVPCYRFYDPANPDELTELDEDEWKRLKAKFDALGRPAPLAVKQQKPLYQQVYVAGRVVLEGPTPLPGNMFSLLFITGEWDRETKTWYGIIRQLLDPQRTRNKSISNALNFSITNAKGGVMYKTGAFVDPIRAKEQWSQSNAWIEMNDAADIKSAVVPREPTPIPPELGQFFSISTAEMSAISGINDDVIGVAQGDTPSPTTQKRMQAALAVLGWFFDAMSQHTRSEARVLLEFIREFWTRGQLIQVGGQINGEAIPLLRTSLPLDYEMVLDESVKHNPNLKAQLWQDLLPLVPSFLRFGFAPFLLEALKYSPWPSQVVEKFQKLAASPQGQPQKPGGGRGGGKQADPMETQARVQKMGADREKTLAEARSIDQDARLKVVETMVDTIASAHKMKHQDELAKHKERSDALKALQILHPKPTPVMGAGQKPPPRGNGGQ